jgi:hypothetical protein
MFRKIRAAFKQLGKRGKWKTPPEDIKLLVVSPYTSLSLSTFPNTPNGLKALKSYLKQTPRGYKLYKCVPVYINGKGGVEEDKVFVQ